MNVHNSNNNNVRAKFYYHCNFMESSNY